MLPATIFLFAALCCLELAFWSFLLLADEAIGKFGPSPRRLRAVDFAQWARTAFHGACFLLAAAWLARHLGA